jgi:hypothetical protein
MGVGKPGPTADHGCFPAAPHPDERLLGEFPSQASVTGQPEGQPHKLGLMVPVKQCQRLTA